MFPFKEFLRFFLDFQVYSLVEVYAVIRQIMMFTAKPNLRSHLFRYSAVSNAFIDVVFVKINIIADVIEFPA